MGLLPIDCEGMGECVDGVQFIINRKTSKKKHLFQCWINVVLTMCQAGLTTSVSNFTQPSQQC